MDTPSVLNVNSSLLDNRGFLILPFPFKINFPYKINFILHSFPLPKSQLTTTKNCGDGLLITILKNYTSTIQEWNEAGFQLQKRN